MFFRRRPSCLQHSACRRARCRRSRSSLESEQDEPVEQDLDLSAYPPSYSCDGSSPETLKLNLFPIDFDWVVTPDGIECDENEVRALAESYEITGPRTPLVVRLLAPLRIVEGRRIPPKFRLVSDLPHFEALKRLPASLAPIVSSSKEMKQTSACRG